jgi:hypothetical protein
MFLPATFNLGVVGTSLGAGFNDTLTFPTIQVFDNESEFIDSTDAPDYTIAHAKDTDSLYVWGGSYWFKYNNDSTV